MSKTIEKKKMGRPVSEKSKRIVAYLKKGYTLYKISMLLDVHINNVIYWDRKINKKKRYKKFLNQVKTYNKRRYDKLKK